MTDKRITGVMIYYYFVCKRKLWYFCHEINMESENENVQLHEIKKSKAIEEAGIWQVKYYLYYLEERGVKNIKGKIDYPLMKKTLLVELSKQDREKLKSIIDEIESMKKEEFPPKFTEQKICKKCAYHDLCFI